jgi:hypothetical protein
MPAIDPKDIDKHLEAMLDRRNIPENQRYKMRNLNSTIKLEFIRQDWAETAQAGKQSQDVKRPGAEDSDTSMAAADGEAQGDDKKKKHSRGRSLHTLSRAMGRDKSREKSKSRPPAGPSKKKSEGTLGRHFRSKSSENVSGDSRPSSSSGASGILAKIKGHVAGGPLDYVAYLRKVQKPELVEVGKLHKLRLLLRNETVAWAEDFIREGGMKEIVDLLHRIMNVEWRFVSPSPFLSLPMTSRLLTLRCQQRGARRRSPARKPPVSESPMHHGLSPPVPSHHPRNPLPSLAAHDLRPGEERPLGIHNPQHHHIRAPNLH